jgi:hypothetical protein
VKIIAPANGATVGPKFNITVAPTDFTPALDLEGKPNVNGYGHYHVFVDSDATSMASMIGMPGSNTFPVNLAAWKNGKHTITVEPVQNDHTPIEGAKPVTITINLEHAAGT